MKALIRTLAAQQGLALALLRAVMGVMLGYAGQLAVFRGDLGVARLDALGIPLPQVLGPVFSLLELGGGLALFVGLFTRVLGVLLALEFLLLSVFTLSVHGLLTGRLEVMLLAGSIVLATHGAGAFAMDRPGHPWEP